MCQTFAALFDAIIEDYHGFTPKERQPATDLGEGKIHVSLFIDLMLMTMSFRSSLLSIPKASTSSRRAFDVDAH